jgi:L-fucose mutarotase
MENFPPMGWRRCAVLKTLTRLHTRDLLHVLASMGHGDELALVDCHFPAVSNARRLVRPDGADLPDVLSACLQLMPLDTFVKDPALRMEVVDVPDHVPEVQKLCQQMIDKWEGRHLRLAGEVSPRPNFRRI